MEPPRVAALLPPERGDRRVEDLLRLVELPLRGELLRSVELAREGGARDEQENEGERAHGHFPSWPEPKTSS